MTERGHLKKSSRGNCLKNKNINVSMIEKDAYYTNKIPKIIVPCIADILHNNVNSFTCLG